MSASLVMNSLFYLSLAAAFLAAWRLTRAMPGTLHWAGASICFSIAFGHLSSGMQAMDLGPRLLNLSLWMLGGVLLINGLRRYHGRAPIWWPWAGLWAALLAAVVWALGVAESDTARIVVSSAAGLVIIGGILHALIAPRTRDAGAGLGFAVVGFGILFAVMAARLYHNLLLGPGDFERLGYLVAFAAMPTSLAAGLLGLLLMTLERLLGHLREANARIEAASRAKTDFLLAMGHELRTPLNAMLGFNDLLANDPRHPLAPRQREYVREIEQGGQRLLRLIEDSRDVERIEHGGVSVRPEVVDVGLLLRDAAALALPASRRADVAIETIPCEWRVLGDRGRLDQVMANLLSNAVKYNRSGGRVMIHAAPPEAGWIRIEVADTGHGIPRTRQPELFQRFNRLGAEAGVVEGSGLGLAITRDLVEAMGGQLGFESQEGAGSRFWIDLPLATG